MLVAKAFAFVLAVLLMVSGAKTVFPDSALTISDVEQSLTYLHERAESDAFNLSIHEEMVPRALDAEGHLLCTKPKSWTSGFYPGTLWQLNMYEKSITLEKAGEKWLDIIESQKYDSTTHDLGFKIYCSFGNAMDSRQSEKWESVIIQAARTLSTRFSPTVGALRSWDHHHEEWQFPVIIDNMMNLELLFEATRLTGDSSFYKIADQHASTTLANHFREDYSSYHVIGYDPETGEILQRHTHQGAAHSSAWSRGQAWGLYGFTLAYRYTRNPSYLQRAERIARFFFEHKNLPEDGIPYWDFNAPGIPDTYRDVSAATIAASALLELATFSKVNHDKYIKWADHVLINLNSAHYQTSAIPFFLNHSVGSVPGKFEIDVPIVYADYYYVESLLRRRDLFN